MSCRCASLPLIAFFRPQHLSAVSQRSHSPARHENPEIPVIQLDYQFFSRDGEPVDEENRAPCPVGRLRCSLAAPPIATALICPLLPVTLDPLGDHRAACAQSGLLRAPGGALERAAARICREAGARVTTNTRGN